MFESGDVSFFLFWKLLVGGYRLREFGDSADDDDAGNTSDEGQCRVACEELGPVKNNHANHSENNGHNVDYFAVLYCEGLDAVHGVFLTRCSVCLSMNKSTEVYP